MCCFFFSSRRRHTRFDCDWSSDVCSSDLQLTDHFQLLRLAKALLHLPPLSHIPDRAGEPARMAVLVVVDTTFGDHPAHFVIRLDKAAFEADFSGCKCLLECRRECVPAFWQQQITGVSAPLGPQR